MLPFNHLHCVQNLSTLCSGLPKDSGIGESAEFCVGEKVVFHDDMSAEPTTSDKGKFVHWLFEKRPIIMLRKQVKIDEIATHETFKILFSHK